MNPLLQQFLLEARDFLQAIGEKLMALESRPDDQELMHELFRLVHTLKGNSGLFDFPEMTRVLHAGEDLMDAVRDGRLAYSQDLADALLDAMDYVGALIDAIESEGAIPAEQIERAEAHVSALRALIPQATEQTAPGLAATAEDPDWPSLPPLAEIPKHARLAASEAAESGAPLWRVLYHPAPDCFFKGEDPFYQARKTPGLIWGRAWREGSWPTLSELDCYRCELRFELLVCERRESILEHFRYIPDEIRIEPIEPDALLAPQCEPGEGQRQAQGADSEGGKRQIALAASAAPPEGPDGVPGGAAPTAEERALGERVIAIQRQILDLPDGVEWLPGRLKACALSLRSAFKALGIEPEGLDEALRLALAQGSARPLADWLNRIHPQPPVEPQDEGSRPQAAPEVQGDATPGSAQGAPRGRLADDPRFGRRAEDSPSARVLKVDQSKIDRLMNLIGEMVVTKNSLPYLARRAEDEFGVRELAREIKAQYAVINRIAEEMQDAIMQIRLLPVSFIFQRFPRLVRDLSRKLGKEVELILEGEETEADKSIIESLADPLIHLVRNSLDHGIEPPEVRRAAGKPPVGRLLIRAQQESDRVIIEVSDDGRGIDPAVVKRKAYERGLIDENQLERISDQEAQNLIFAPGFSTAEQVTDLSGRGVGMDVVRTALERIGGTVELQSAVGQGTSIRLSLPLSMAVTNVMIIESDRQIFGVPMESIVETVRLSQDQVHVFKQHRTAVLRGKIVPLVALNELLQIPAAPKPNAEGELAVLVIRAGNEQMGLLVDGFREVVDVILKPLPGELAKLACYAGTALLGDGSVLMVLNPKGLL